MWIQTKFMLGGKPFLPRKFNISPAVGGKSIWDLDQDGPLVLGTAGTWTIELLSPSIRFEAKAWGSSGGGNNNLAPSVAGAGGAIIADVELADDSTYALIVPTPGSGPTAGSPGGGSGQTNGYGGGGYAMIKRNLDNDPVLIAPGGGGGGNGSNDNLAGAGGGTTGQSTSGGMGGTKTGGTQSTGGSPNGSYLQGGTSYEAGGGGGGYYGGGGGTTDATTYRSGGAGGSSYANPNYVLSSTSMSGNRSTPGNESDPDRGSAGSLSNPGKIVLK